nr:immunoglobulin heavy chain junction region [Macaca mulatta]MOY24012.1 immunoglobulin heavy chain junction region [Macaca mulatta]MOY28623.1 immunoglobulin heavy chain junction region [Macaca mulatta]MOY29417.1 immunoglobulin heavy chain junction region [Macaca mulatta]MOY29946.1 immunoglobulin heavy chain junction region [Macaca mulatta]
CARGAVSDVW